MISNDKQPLTNNNKIIFAGNGHFAAIQVENLSKAYSLEIITQKNYTEVKKTAQRLKLKIHQVKNKLELENILKQLKPELLIVSDFGIILSLKALKIPKLTINTHPSLLPKYRGPSPYVTALLNGDKETGVSIIKMAKKVDAGPIFIQEKLKIEKEDTQTSLREKLGKLAAKLLINNLEKITTGKIKPISQNEKQASLTQAFKKEDGRINWDESAEAIERKIRAFNPWPGTFTFFDSPKKTLRVKILEAVVEKGNNSKAGEIKIENGLKIKTSKDFLIIKNLQPEGKKEMTAKEFLSGYNIISLVK